MSEAALRIVNCPAERREEALALVLTDIAPSQRQEIAGPLLESRYSSWAAALFVAMQSDDLRGASWGQFQPGNTAIFWPPRFAGAGDATTARSLAQEAIATLDSAGLAMTQALLPAADANDVPLLEAVGFRHLADLIYLSCEAERFPAAAPASDVLQFVPYYESQRGRLMAIIERTYEGTADCVGIEGARQMDDVVDGYMATGTYCASNWHFVQSRDEASGEWGDAGVLLLASHAGPRHFELVYMGVVPEVRGRGWGGQIARQAQWLARCAGAERLVLAVDAANRPALAVYRAANFDAWDRRSVYVRTLATT